MGSTPEHQQRSHSAFSTYSKSPISPTRGGESRDSLAREHSSSSFARRSSSVARQSSLADKHQEEAYFADLLSYSLERLGKEPELLAAERDQLTRQSQESAVQHYRGFIEVAGCLQTLKQEVGSISSHLAVLQDDLPALAQACEQFTQEAKQHLGKRAQNKQLMKQQGLLLEILEVPSLMASCLRTGSYDDALDLRAFVAKTALLHPDLPVVKALVQETEASSREMLAALLERLRSSIQLPECLRVVAHLRRLAPFLEPKLRQIFLQCREEWLSEVVAGLEEGSAYDYLKRLTDVHRLQLFDVVMQFRAIFTNDAGAGEGEAREGDGGAALYSWAEHRVVFYLETLASQLPKIREGGGLASVLEHCMYCGLSLGRVGLDFRALLPPIFEACIVNLFTSSVQSAVTTCLAVLDSHKWVSLPASVRRQKSLPPSSPDPSRTSPSPSKTPGAPPYELMEHPPLAVLTNGLLAALNELRHCAPLSLAPRLAGVLQEALQGVGGALRQYKETRVLDTEEAELFRATCTALTATLCPFIADCFSKIFPAPGQALDLDQLASVLGTPTSTTPAAGGAAEVPVTAGSVAVET